MVTVTAPKPQRRTEHLLQQTFSMHIAERPSKACTQQACVCHTHAQSSVHLQELHQHPAKYCSGGTSDILTASSHMPCSTWCAQRRWRHPVAFKCQECAWQHVIVRMLGSKHQTSARAAKSCSRHWWAYTSESSDLLAMQEIRLHQQRNTCCWIIFQLVAFNMRAPYGRCVWRHRQRHLHPARQKQRQGSQLR